MVRTRARVCAPSVRMPACPPVRETEGTPIASSAMASSELVIRSPLARRRSTSRPAGSGESACAISMSLSVSPAMALTTTTTRSHFSRVRATRPATSRIRSRVATDVPPNFWTMSFTQNPIRPLSGAPQTPPERLRAEGLPPVAQPLAEAARWKRIAVSGGGFLS